MTQKENLQTTLEQNALDMVEAEDTGARHAGGLTGRVIAYVAVCWSLFQLWYASTLPFLFAHYVPILNDSEARAVHLAFALFLGFLTYPAFAKSPRASVPWNDWLFALLGAMSAGYLCVFNDALAERPGLPTTEDIVVAGIGLVLLLEATRRALGPPLMVLAMVFLAYVFFGDMAPEMIAWKGASLNRAMSHLWLTSEGVFGVALGVSTSFVFLFVLFGALLDQAGVLASGMTGLISGSSIANTVTTGTFTIPLMRRVGFSGEKAGAVEVAASVNGQIMPPVMGAAAFLMVEYVGIPYLDVIKHAFLPAILSYIALLYLVHLEALKAGMEGMARPERRGGFLGLAVMLMQAAGLIVLLNALYYSIQFVQSVAGEHAVWLIAALLGGAYVALVWVAARAPHTEKLLEGDALEHLPTTAEVARTGLHFLLPIGVLVWCLMIERLSPGLSAFWGTVTLLLLTFTQPLLLLFLQRGELAWAALLEGRAQLIEGLGTGARNMVAIAIATAAAGIIMGTVSLTGIAQVLTELVEFLSGGSLVLMLVLVAILSLILGMGLPTTANYIVVSGLLAGVVVELGAANGLVVPLIAVHLFVFYFGIMADVTPPVGVASFAAAAISRGDPLKTGGYAFLYSLRTVILPFFFIFNTKLLLIGVEGPVDLALTVLGALGAVLLFSAATQSFFLVRNRLWETGVLLLVAFTLFRPQFWIDQWQAPFDEVPIVQATSLIEEVEENGSARLIMRGETLEGDVVTRRILLPLGPAGSLTERFAFSGLAVRAEGEQTIVDDVDFASTAEKLGVDFDWEILALEVPVDRPNAYWSFLPAVVLFGLVLMSQRRRRREHAA
jgi:TRAP transporter 4TM/12TM fusion protein